MSTSQSDLGEALLKFSWFLPTFLLLFVPSFLHARPPASSDPQPSSDSSSVASVPTPKNGGNILATFGIGLGSGFVTKESRPVRNRSAVIESEKMSCSNPHLQLEVDWDRNGILLGGFVRSQIGDSSMLYGGRGQYRVQQSASSEMWLRAGLGTGEIAHVLQIQDRVDVTLAEGGFSTVGMAFLRSIGHRQMLKLAVDYFKFFEGGTQHHFDLTVGLEFQL